MADNITINEGTAKAMAADDVSDVYYQVVKLDVGAGGASDPFTGTVAEITNITDGTVAEIGTVTGMGTVAGVGVLGAGTVATYPAIHSDEWGTTVETTGTATGTIKPAVVGSAIYITDLIISSNSGGTIVVGDGTPTVKLAEAYLGENGGFVSNFKTPRHTTSGSALVFNQPGSGTITIIATGYVD